MSQKFNLRAEMEKSRQSHSGEITFADWFFLHLITEAGLKDPAVQEALLKEYHDGNGIIEVDLKINGHEMDIHELMERIEKGRTHYMTEYLKEMIGDKFVQIDREMEKITETIRAAERAMRSEIRSKFPEVEFDEER